jgi:hypothetical protein
MYGWMEASCSFGSHPSGINKAVMNPHAMNAPMLGITMADKNFPKRCTPLFIFFLLYP